MSSCRQTEWLAKSLLFGSLLLLSLYQLLLVLILLLLIPVLTCMLLLLNLLLLRLLLLLNFMLKHYCNQTCGTQPTTHDLGRSPHTNAVACMCWACTLHLTCRFPCLGIS